LLHRAGWLFLNEKATLPVGFYMQWKRNRYGPSARGLIRGLARWLFIFAAAISCSLPAYAHVGSPDIYAEGNAGPYRLFVTIRPPTVIPGVAEIEVRVVPDKTRSDKGSDATVDGIQIAPIPLTGEASKHPPVADPMKQSATDRQFFTGALWIMAPGSWQVRFTVAGSQGSGVLSIPVPATSSSTQGMQAGLGIMLGSLGLLLVGGVVGIVGAAVRDAQLPAGAPAPAASRRRAWIAMGVALTFVAAIVIFGKLWWNSEAGDYSQKIYKPLTMQATLTPDNHLDLKIDDPGWLKSRLLDDFVLDHDHLMHLYLLHEPGYDLVYHLHPDQRSPGRFDLALPAIPAGQYRLYADVVHATGFPETLVASITLPQITGRPLAGDDAQGIAPALSPAAGTACPTTQAAGPQFKLPDGYTMLWNNASVLPAKTPQSFAFTLLDPAGKPPADTALYMGMLGHAAFVKDDSSVFAHVHPSGTVSMAALMMAAQQNQPNASAASGPASAESMPGMDMSGGKMPSEAAASRIPNTVSFPYGFPTPGSYRIFVQMKHGQTIETAAFDACASPAKQP
jgi:hypothetical protein